MKSLLRSGFFLALCVVLVQPALASVTGYVKDTEGVPVDGALITFTDESNPENYYLDYTDETGRYEIAPTIVSVAHEQPAPFTLQQNFPNPFNPSTTIPYSLSTSGHVRLDIFNITGQRVTTLVDTHIAEGAHTVSWNGRDESGKAVGAGIYLYRLVSGDHSEARKMLLIDGGAATDGTASPSYHSHEAAKRADGKAFRVTITSDDIVDYEESGFTIVDGGIYDFIVQRLTVVHGITFVGIPGGTFRMGDIQNYNLDPQEKPVHDVSISAFEMSIYKVTQEQYRLVNGSHQTYFDGTNLPVENVTWYDAVEFCNALSDSAGLDSCYDEST